MKIVPGIQEAGNQERAEGTDGIVKVTVTLPESLVTRLRIAAVEGKIKIYAAVTQAVQEWLDARK